MEIELIKIDTLRPFDRNPKMHPEHQLKKLEKSITEFGWTSPILATTDNMIVAGHARLEAAKRLNVAEVPVIYLDLPYEKAIAYVLADNRLAELAETDNEMLFDILSELSELPDFDIELTGFDLDEIDSFNPEVEKDEDILSTTVEEVDGMSEVFGLKTDVDFEGSGRYDFPALKEDMILDIAAPACWAGPTATKTPPPYVYNYGTDSTMGLDFTRTVVSFYTEDSRFERLYTHNAEIAARFLNKKIIGMVSPNYSTYFRMPKAMRLWNIFRSRWVSRYFQGAGIKVIPDISCGIDDIDCVFDGIPPGTPVCIQAHRSYNKEELKEKLYIIDKTIEVLEPSRIWVYATEDRIEMFPSLADDRVEWITPRYQIQQDYKKELAANDK